MKFHNFELETKTTINWNYKISDHPIKGYYNEEKNLYFHLIPKNASSFIAGHVIGLGWKEVTSLNNFSFNKGLIILREPIQRWISGIFEFFNTYNLIDDNFINEWPAYVKLLQHNPIQDGHTSPQEEFLYGLDFNKLNFAFMSEYNNINDKIQIWLASNGYANTMHKYEKQNESKNKNNLFVYNLIKETVDNNKDFKNSLREHFQTSYRLIEWVTNNNKWI